MVCVFAREINGSLTRLVKRIDKQIAKNTDKKLCSFVVFLTDDSEALTAKVEKLAEKAKIKNVPLTIAESLAGPPAYKISEDAEVTVLLWKGKGPEVRVNHAFKAGELKKEQIAAVIKDIPKILEN